MRSMTCALARPVLRSIWVDATQPWHLGREVEEWNHLVPCSSPVLSDGGVLPSKIAVLEYGQRSFCQFGVHGRVDRRLSISYGLAVLLGRKAHEIDQPHLCGKHAVSTAAMRPLRRFRFGLPASSSTGAVRADVRPACRRCGRSRRRAMPGGLCR